MAALLPRAGRACALVLACAVLGFAPTASAHGPADLLAGIQAYDDGELDKAAQLLDEALRSLDSPRDRGLGWLYRGLCYAVRNDVRAAGTAFDSALLADPLLAPDRRRLPPLALALFDESRRRLAAEVSVDASERGARVVLDGQYLGEAPLRTAVPPGAHRLRVASADGARAYELPLQLESRQKLQVRALLATDYGYLRVHGLQALQSQQGDKKLQSDKQALSVQELRRVQNGAELWLDGRRVTPLPAGSLPVAVGRHELRVHAPTLAPATRVVTVTAAGTTELTVEVFTRAERPPWYQRPRAWSLLTAALSGATLVTALGLGLSARSLGEDLRQRTTAGTLTAVEYDRLADAAQTRARGANIFVGVGGALAVTGLVLWAIGDSEQQRPALRFSLHPAGGQLSGRF